MHRSQYKFSKQRKKCDVSVKSTITKRTISRRKKVVVTTKNPPEEKQNQRERERESMIFFVMDNLEGIGERWKGSNKKFI